MRSVSIFAAGFLSALALVAAVGIIAHLHAEDWLVGSGVAIHISGGHHCNSFTAGIGIEHRISETWRAAAGLYDNSNCNVSAYTAGVWLPLRFDRIRLGALGGLVTGYRASIMPVGGLAASYEARRWGSNLIYIPPVGNSGNVLWWQFKVPF